MKTKLIILLVWCSVSIYGQEHIFINSDTRLYSTKNTSAEFLGSFGYGAQIQLLSNDNDGWSKIKADNLTEGYVQTKFISQTLNAGDIKITDKQNPILTADDYYGNNHLFVIAASVKAKYLPNKESKTREILTTGDAVAVNYCPINPEEWVNVSGSFNEEYAKYIQRKHLGKRPDFNEMIKNFDKLAQFNIAERKTISERLVELAWNSKPETLLPAYDRYYEVAQQLQNPKLIADTEMYIVLAKGVVHHKSTEEIQIFLKNAEFVIHDIKFKNFGISYDELVKNFGEHFQMREMSNDCGVYLSDKFYYFQDLELSVDEKQNKAELVKVYMNEQTKFILNANFTLDNIISEKDFITKYASYIDTNKTPHIYYFPIEAGNYIVEFRDGKIYSIEVFYSC